MRTEEHLRDALVSAVDDGIEVLPDVEGLLRGIDKHVRVARARRAFASGTCVVLVVVAGATLLLAGRDGEAKLRTGPVAHKSDVREPDPYDKPELLPPAEKKVEPAPAPAPKPEPEPAPIVKAPAPEPVKTPVPTTAKPAPTPTTAKATAPPADTTPPHLQVTSPASGTHVTEAHTTFTGDTEPGALVYTVDRQVPVDPAGHWQVTLKLAPGKNVVWFKAKDAAYNKTVVEVVVYYDAPAEEYAFTANQKYGSSSASPPYEGFYGTGSPGSVISVTSAYGSTEFQVTSDGKWSGKIYFETAPVGETFEITVSAPQGSQTFSFTRTA